VTERRQDEFTSKDMLFLLNGKVDQILDTLSKKADVDEVKSLRERMHKVEGGQAMFGNVIEMVNEIRGLYREMLGRVTTLETEQVSEEAVKKAIDKRTDQTRSTIRWAAGLVGTLIGGNIVITLSRGG
jgi:hypothetical protein